MKRNGNKLKRLTLRDSQRLFEAYAPFEGAKSKPSFMDRKPRSDTGIKRGRQEETSWLHSVIKPFKQFIRLAWPVGSVWLARNNNGSYPLPNGGRLTYGLGTGTSDSIGWTCIQITPDMVGQTIAQFTAFEAKKDGEDPTEAQQQFLAAVRAAGGRALVGSPGDPPSIVPTSLAANPSNA